jgi:hypothetical protein
MDPRDVDLHTGSMNNFFELDALQGFKQVVLKHHERFTDKTLNHIVSLSGIDTENRVAAFFPAMLLGKIKIFIF